MDRYLSVAKMIEVEKASDRAGHTYPMMMACAGRSLADEILLAYSLYFDRPNVLGLVGSGNNGGDALVAMITLVDDGLALLRVYNCRSWDGSSGGEFLSRWR